jgi:hypothetical protein
MPIGPYVCHRCKIGTFNSFSSKNPHLEEVHGVLPHGASHSRIRYVPLATLRHPQNQAPPDDDAPPSQPHPDAA